MTTVLARRAIIVDDDPLLRGVIGQLMAERGFDVLCDADSPSTAFDALDATDARVVILDLALRTGHGEHLLQQIRDTHPMTRVVVFSSFVNDPSALLSAGATAVVTKPDFARLEEVLDEIRDLPENRAAVNRRRTSSPQVAASPPLATSISGFEPWASFREAVDRLAPGDAVMALDVSPSRAMVEHWDDVFRIDYRLAVGRAAAVARREADRVSLSPGGVPVLLILGGHVEAPGLVHERITTWWKREVNSGVPVAAFAHVTDESVPWEVIERTLRAVTDASTTSSHPLRLA